MSKALCLVLAVVAVSWVFLPQAARGATDQEVQQPAAVQAVSVPLSIAKAKDWIIGARQGAAWPEDKNYDGGHSCLAIYTLAYIGENPDGPVLGPAVDQVVKLSPDKTYVRAVRALAMSAIIRKLDKAGSARSRPAHEALHSDIRWLIDAQGRKGGWNYLPMNENNVRFDFSNTQMAILALWQARWPARRFPHRLDQDSATLLRPSTAGRAVELRRPGHRPGAAAQ